MSLGAANQVAAATQSISTAGTNAGAVGAAPEARRGQVESETAPQFGEILQKVQTQYGARPEKGREIKKTLGKDDFLRIMITQMKNQDPTNPFKAEQMAAEMAQFTTVEQLKNMNESLTRMSTSNQPLERMAMTGMIGKTVTVDRGRFPHQEGTNDSLSFGLSRDAATVKVELVDEHGETVLTKDLGKLKAGENSFAWDGKKLNSLPARTGSYMIRVEAADEQGARIDTNSVASSRVIGVSFEGAEPVFLIGDHLHQEKVTMKNIVRIDDNGAQAAISGGQSAAGPSITSAAPGGTPKATPSFFTFKKGVGSSNLDAAGISPEAQRAISEYKSGLTQGPARSLASGAAPSAPPPAPASERGFPNGLHDDEEPKANLKGGDHR